DLGLLAAVAGVDDDEALRAVEDARRAKLVDEVDGVLDRWRFAHALVQETLLEELTTSRRIRMHERVVRALERSFGTAPGPHLVVLAHHASEAAAAGNTVRAAEYALLAAEHVLQRFGYEEAARLCTIGLEALDLGADDRPLRCKLLLVRGDAYDWVGDRRADKDLDAATAMSRDLEGHPRLYAEAMVRSFALLPGRYDAPMVRQLRDALARLPDDEIDLRATLHGMLAAATSFGEPRQTAQAHARQALELASRARDTELAGLAIYFASFPSAVSGETRYADQILDLFRGVVGPLEMPARSMRTVALCARCDLGGARDELQRLRQVVEEIPAAMGRYAVLVFESTLATVEGRFRDASRSGREAGVVAGEMFRSVYGDLATLTPAMAAMPRLRWQGRSAELVPFTEAAAGSLPGVGWRAALAAVLADVGRLDDAAELLEELSKDRFGGFAPQALAYGVDRYSIALAIEAAAAVGHQGWLRELSDLLEPAAALASVLAYGPAPVQWIGSCHLFLGIAARALAENAAAESHLRSALDIHEREGARPLAAQTRYELALSLRESGDPASRAEASSHARVALAVADDLGLAVLRRRLDEADL
ncbi:MAG TPA: hypothetical protein VM933_03450, partial [Acidimicrobiales bacterium]|nr:hypothetical protein [Acidimicrobiales bacterium]